MFWKKKATEAPPASTGGAQAAPEMKAEKLQGPKDVPEMVGRHLVVQLKQEPDWVWSLRSVIRHRPQSGKESFDFRIYNPVQTSSKKVKVKDFTSLDSAPELILFQGWFDKKMMQVHMEEKKAQPASAEPAKV